MPRADRLSAGAIKLLQEKQIASFVTLMPDGSPQVSPVWIDVEPDGTHILVNTAEGRVKARNIARDPRVAVSVVDAHNSRRVVVVRGTIVERRTAQEGADDHIDQLAKKYLGADRYPFRRSGPPRLLLRIKPQFVWEQEV